jgi:hypothetical protein
MPTTNIDPMATVVMTEDELQTKLAKISLQLKSLQSRKCRLRHDHRSSSKQLLTALLVEEDNLKQLRLQLSPKDTTTTTFTDEDIDKLSLQATRNAIRSIQSKKSLTRWLTTIDGDNDEYRHATTIEAKLKLHLSKLEPTKVIVGDIITNIDNLTKDDIIQLLKKL